ncbi:MAG: thiamine phosphate synthase [Alphaproteobacteria bacterium]|nr:thiamine phosphate synthase [Alphaproteobacteria bacterium]
MNDDARCRLYLITPPRIEPASFADRLALALDAGDVGCVQLRLKDVDDGEIRRAAERLRPVAQDRGVALIMNDRPDLAADTGCDGVHVGQEDASYDDARALLGGDSIVGVTCKNSRHLAMEAAEKGADYVAFGPFFDSATKPRTDPARKPADLEILRWWGEMMTVPCVAIGGITVENCPPLVEAGADFLAVVAGVWGHPDGPAAAVKAFNRVFDERAAVA